MSICGDCNFYCKERRICIREEKFYFESFPSCEKYEKNIDMDKLGGNLMKGFKIICKECRKEIDVKDTSRYEDAKKEGFSIFSTTSSTVVIECECGNNVWVK